MTKTTHVTPESIIIEYPFPPADMSERMEMEIYARFMRHLRIVPTSRPEIRILASIQFVSDMMNLSDAHVAKILIDLGLRAPRMAFPETYLEYADHALMRETWEVGCANQALRELQSHWRKIGEDCFAAFRRHYPHLAEGVFVTS